MVIKATVTSTPTDIAGFISKETGKLIEGVKKVVTKAVDEKGRRIAEFKKEANRMVSLANKRLRRLEENNLTDSPAYQGYLKSGGKYFSVKGKTYNELQAEVARMRTFIEANTSTVRGINNYLKEMAENTGIKYKNLKDLRAKSSKFFELASKIEQYLRTVNDMATAIGYQKIWESINEYVKENKIDLAEGEVDIDRMTAQITQALEEYEKPEFLNFDSEYKGAGSQWFHLPKE